MGDVNGLRRAYSYNLDTIFQSKIGDQYNSYVRQKP